MSHMMTNGSIEELHDFAKGLGLKREWFQNTGNHPHYDVSESKRKAAINRGARAVSAREIFRICVIEKREKDAKETKQD